MLCHRAATLLPLAPDPKPPKPWIGMNMPPEPPLVPPLDSLPKVPGVPYAGGSGGLSVPNGRVEIGLADVLGEQYALRVQEELGGEGEAVPPEEMVALLLAHAADGAALKASSEAQGKEPPSREEARPPRSRLT